MLLVSIASELKFVVRVLTFCARMELRGDETVGAAVVGDAAVILFSMLWVLLLLLISPLVVPIKFSVEWRRLPDVGS